uniref:Actin-related protein 2 n=1 Tax=Leptocylindrus danicus TaxID=163516 RepID=A0A7S2K1R8_9STRA|mmetsp:Transcript_15160/g.22371  ORF Transcript_15160/g.22371 Transcript_15160/m.22371 type:complete len:383 (+) Transcript_15160:175-1323(+)
MAEMNIENLRTLVCDQGSGCLKIGSAGDNQPSNTIPSLVARDAESGLNCVGEDALKYPQCKSFITNGIVRDWDALDRLWDMAFRSKLGLDDASNHKILLSEQPFNPLDNRKMMLERLFETFLFGAVNFSSQAMLSLYAQGLLTGVVVDIGYESTNIVPVYDGFLPQHLTRRLDIGGNDITQYLNNLLIRRGYRLYNHETFNEINRAKEKLCYTALDLEQERALARETTVLVEAYTLPDGTTVKVGQERFEAPEALFDPTLVNIECKGLCDAIFDTIQKADIDTRAKYMQHIVICGGSSMFPDFAARLENGIRQKYLTTVLNGDTERLQKFPVNVEASPMRKDLVFLGGSVLAELMNNKDDFWITKMDYNEEGIDRALSKLSL